MDDTFIFEGDDLVYRVQWDSEGASGDGWDEPRSPAHAWVHRLWIAGKPVFSGKGISTQGDGWVEIPKEALRPGLLDVIEDECHGYAFPELEDA